MQGVSNETWALVDANIGSATGTFIPAGAGAVNGAETHECVWECCATAIEHCFGDMSTVASMSAVSRPSLSLRAGSGSLREALSTAGSSYTARFLPNTAGAAHHRLRAFQVGRLCTPGAYVAVPVGRDGNRSHAVAIVVAGSSARIVDQAGSPTTLDLACGGQCTGLHIVQVLPQMEAPAQKRRRWGKGKGKGRGKSKRVKNNN